MEGRVVTICVAALLSVVLACGCRKRAEPNASCDKMRLAEYECRGDCGNPLCGRWRWESSNMGADIFTPSTTGHCQVLCLSHDSTWRWILDGKLMDTGWYRTARKVAKKGWEKEDEPYNEILFLSHKTPPEDRSKYSGEGVKYIGGSGYAYSIEARNLYFGSVPGLIGGASYAWVKR